ncbi:MAG: tetratricopeptide repeat protein, partial [Thermoanaerobaculia bacterium]
MAVSREKVVHNAEKYVSRGKIDAAIREYRKLLADNPNDISTLNRVGDLYARIDRNSEAIDLFHQIAQQYADDGFFVKAIAIYKKIIKLDPTLLDVYEQLADLYHRQGLVNEARTQYHVLADYYLKHDRTAQAVGIYRRMVELEPDDPAHRAKLADLYRQEDQVEEAMGEYRAIAELMLQHQRGREAAQVYERALDVTAEDLGFITDAVLKLKEEGHVASAAHFLSVAVERNPKAEKVARIAGLEGREAPAADGPDTAPVDTAALEPEAAESAQETETAASVAEGAGEGEPAGGDAPAAEPPAAAPMEDGESEDEAGAGELDGELFALELDEDEPDSLVTPPADMLEDRDRRGAAWSDDSPGERPPAAQAAAGTGEAEAEPPPETAEVVAEGESGGTFEFELDLDAGDEELLEAAGTSPAEPTPAPGGDGDGASAPGDDGLDHDLLERTAAQVQAAAASGEPDDLLTEAEVLAKYGIEEKALDRLAELLQREPGNLEAFQLMVGIHLDAERHDRAAAVAGQMAEVAEAQSDGEIWPEVRSRLEAAGFAVAPGHVQPPAGEAAPPSGQDGPVEAGGDAAATEPGPAAEDAAVE